MTATVFILDPAEGLPAIPSRGHDYDPEWDYEVVAPSEADAAALAAVATEIGRTLLPGMGFGAAVVFCVEEGSLGEPMARYVDGTSSCPMIAVDMEGVRDASLAGDGFEAELHATIAHELGHAYVDARASDDTHDIDEMEEEGAVEDFATDWARYRIVGTRLLDAFLDDAEIKDAEAPKA